jgi:ubiquinone biosynthesis protein COQ4
LQAFQQSWQDHHVRTRFLLKALSAYFRGRVGDSAVYKAAAFGAPPWPEIDVRLRRIDDPFPSIDVNALGSLQPRTFGRAYVEFLKTNRLRPFAVSEHVIKELMPAHLLHLRYLLLHDAFHVLLDFDATLPGELGVWAYVSAQRYGSTYDRGVKLGRWLFPALAPWKIKQFRACISRGERLAKTSDSLICQPLEKFFPQPLADVRMALGLI